MNEHKFDGFDLNWQENLGFSEKDPFLQYVKELRRAFEKEGNSWEIIMSVPVVRLSSHLSFRKPILPMQEGSRVPEFQSYASKILFRFKLIQVYSTITKGKNLVQCYDHF